jgi:hypothetical protein
LEVTDQGPAATFADKQGRPRAVLDVTGEGPSISLHDELARPRADLELTDRGPGCGCGIPMPSCGRQWG